jgi:hypothetical protein
MPYENKEFNKYIIYYKVTEGQASANIYVYKDNEIMRIFIFKVNYIVAKIP